MRVVFCAGTRGIQLRRPSEVSRLVGSIRNEGSELRGHGCARRRCRRGLPEAHDRHSPCRRRYTRQSGYSRRYDRPPGRQRLLQSVASFLCRRRNDVGPLDNQPIYEAIRLPLLRRRIRWPPIRINRKLLLLRHWQDQRGARTANRNGGSAHAERSLLCNFFWFLVGIPDRLPHLCTPVRAWRSTRPQGDILICEEPTDAPSCLLGRGSWLEPRFCLERRRLAGHAAPGIDSVSPSPVRICRLQKSSPLKCFSFRSARSLDRWFIVVR